MHQARRPCLAAWPLHGLQSSAACKRQCHITRTHVCLTCAPLRRAFGSAAVVAGVIAQHLQVHPNDGPDDVKRHLLELATPHVVTEAGPNTTNSLVYAEPTNVEAPATAGGGLSTGAVVGIAVGCAAGGCWRCALCSAGTALLGWACYTFGSCAAVAAVELLPLLLGWLQQEGRACAPGPVISSAEVRWPACRAALRCRAGGGRGGPRPSGAQAAAGAAVAGLA